MLTKPPVTHLVVGNRADARDDELAVPGDVDLVVTEVGVLVENTSILLVDADGTLDRLEPTGACAEVSIKVGDAAEAIAAKSKRVGKSSDTILSGVERVLAVVRKRGLAVLQNVRNHAARKEGWHLLVPPSQQPRDGRRGGEYPWHHRRR